MPSGSKQAKASTTSVTRVLSRTSFVHQLPSEPDRCTRAPLPTRIRHNEHVGRCQRRGVAGATAPPISQAWRPPMIGTGGDTARGQTGSPHRPVDPVARCAAGERGGRAGAPHRPHSAGPQPPSRDRSQPTRNDLHPCRASRQRRMGGVSGRWLPPHAPKGGREARQRRPSRACPVGVSPCGRGSVGHHPAGTARAVPTLC